MLDAATANANQVINAGNSLISKMAALVLISNKINDLALINYTTGQLSSIFKQSFWL